MSTEEIELISKLLYTIGILMGLWIAGYGIMTWLDAIITDKKKTKSCQK